VEVEFDVAQVAAVSSLWDLDPGGEPLKPQAGVVEHDLDRIHALGGSPGGGSAAADKLGEFRAQHRLQVLHKPRGDASSLACCEAQPAVRSDDDFNATADNLAITTGVRPAAPRGHWSRAVAIPASPSVVLSYGHEPSKPQRGEEVNSGFVMGYDATMTRR